MKPLTQYGLMAEKHWREFLPKSMAELQTKGRLHELLLEAGVKTGEEMDRIRRQLTQQHDSAWEIVRAHYIFLPPET